MNVFSVSSFEMVADGKQHSAELLAVKKNFTLRVDGGLARSIINEGDRDFLKLTTPLFIGGIPAEAGENAFTQWHLRNLTSFKGNTITYFCLLRTSCDTSSRPFRDSIKCMFIVHTIKLDFARCSRSHFKGISPSIITFHDTHVYSNLVYYA